MKTMPALTWQLTESLASGKGAAEPRSRLGNYPGLLGLDIPPSAGLETNLIFLNYKTKEPNLSGTHLLNKPCA